MKAIILAAGIGTRLLPYTKNLPKCMVDFCGRPLIEYQIDILRDNGVKEIAIVKGYLEHKINYPNLKYYLNEEYMNTNMVWSLFCAKKELHDEVIISYGDIIYSPKIVNQILHSENTISTVIDKSWRNYWEYRFEDPLTDAESLVINDNNFILEIGAKTTTYDNIHGQYIGLLKFSTEGSEILRGTLETLYNSNRKIGGKPFKSAYMTDLLQEMIIQGLNIKAIITDDPWIEIDSISDLVLPVNKLRLEQIFC